MKENPQKSAQQLLLRLNPTATLPAARSAAPRELVRCASPSASMISQKGGLDLFLESYVQIDTVRIVKSGAVIGKKGRVTSEFLEMVGEQSPTNKIL